MLVTSSPARKNITRRTREEMVPRSPLPNNAPPMQRRPKPIMTMLMSESTVGIYTQRGSGSRERGQRVKSRFVVSHRLCFSTIAARLTTTARLLEDKKQLL